DSYRQRGAPYHDPPNRRGKPNHAAVPCAGSSAPSSTPLTVAVGGGYGPTVYPCGAPLSSTIGRNGPPAHGQVHGRLRGGEPGESAPGHGDGPQGRGRQRLGRGAELRPHLLPGLEPGNGAG